MLILILWWAYLLVMTIRQKKLYISYTIDENCIMTIVTTQLLLQKIYNLLLLSTLDKSPSFILGVWKNLCKIFCISINLYIFFYPKIERQDEIANYNVEKHFYIFVNDQQDNLSSQIINNKICSKKQ